MGVLFRFVIVGMLNSGVGYAIILLGLWLGAGDYLANAISYGIGVIIAFTLHRRWTFSVNGAVSVREAVRFGLAVIVSYSANLAVIAIARSLGYVNNPWVQATAMVSYSLTFFILTRFVVFAHENPKRSFGSDTKG